MTPNKRRPAAKHPSKRPKPPAKPEKPEEPVEEPPIQTLGELPEGCETEPYTGEVNESGEPTEDPGPGRTWYQGSDGRYYNCPQSGG